MARPDPFVRAAWTFLGLVAAGALVLGCGGDSKPKPPVRVTLPVPAASATHTLTAGTPANVVFPVSIDPSVGVASASVDLSATLAELDVVVSARSAARAAALPAEGDAQVTLRVAPVASGDTVCEDGALYGPFNLSLGAGSLPTAVSPASVTASSGTVALLNGGLFVMCLQAVYPVDATVTLNGVAVEYGEDTCDEAPADFSGTWTGTYECSSSCGPAFGSAITLTVIQDGRSASYSDGEATFEGSVCGNELRFGRETALDQEHGKLTLAANGTAVKTSTYRSKMEPFCHGQCTDSLQKGTGGGGASGPGRCGLPITRGCVDLSNHGPTPVHIVPTGQPTGPGTLVPALTLVMGAPTPGVAHTTVEPNTVGSLVPFEVRSPEGTQLDTATCTVGSYVWTEINPEVVWQQTGDLTCYF